LEESKAAFEEYQHHSTQELDDGLAKLEEEKQTLQVRACDFCFYLRVVGLGEGFGSR